MTARESEGTGWRTPGPRRVARRDVRVRHRHAGGDHPRPVAGRCRHGGRRRVRPRPVRGRQYRGRQVSIRRQGDGDDESEDEDLPISETKRIDFQEGLAADRRAAARIKAPGAGRNPIGRPEQVDEAGVGRSLADASGESHEPDTQVAGRRPLEIEGSVFLLLVVTFGGRRGRYRPSTLAAAWFVVAPAAFNLSITRASRALSDEPIRQGRLLVFPVEFVVQRESSCEFVVPALAEEFEAALRCVQLEAAVASLPGYTPPSPDDPVAAERVDLGSSEGGGLGYRRRAAARLETESRRTGAGHGQI